MHCNLDKYNKIWIYCCTPLFLHTNVGTICMSKQWKCIFSSLWVHVALSTKSDAKECATILCK